MKNIVLHVQHVILILLIKFSEM